MRPIKTKINKDILKMNPVTTIKLTGDNVRTWNMIKNRVNLNKLLNQVLAFYFSKMLTSDEKRELIKQKMAIAYREKQEVIEEAEMEYQLTVSSLQKNLETIEVTP